MYLSGNSPGQIAASMVPCVLKSTMCIQTLQSPTGWSDVAEAWVDIWNNSLFQWVTAGRNLKTILIVTWVARLHVS